MVNLFRFALFWIMRYFNDGLPSRAEARWASKIPYSTHPTTLNVLGSAAITKKYSCGADLRSLSVRYDVTRERVRQMILKGCRLAREKQ